MPTPIGDPKRSKLHRFTTELVKKLFPSFRVLNEYPIDVGGSRTLPVDICLPDLHVCIECHGRQHYEQVSHFHTEEEFKAQQDRDAEKKRTIIEAGWGYVVVRYDEMNKLTTTQLAKRISKALKSK